MITADLRLSSLDLTPSPRLATVGVSLRREAAADRSFLRGLYATTRMDELAQTGWDDAQKAAFIDHQFAAQSAHLQNYRPDADYLIVQRGVSPIGRLYIDRGVDPWRLVEVSLTPDEAGRGIGAALVEWVVARARESHATAVDLHVTLDNVRAAAFYSRLGFVDAPSDFETHHRMIRSTTCLS